MRSSLKILVLGLMVIAALQISSPLQAQVSAVSRAVNPGEDTADVSLRKGGNVLMLKVVNGTGGWGACARFADQDGRPLLNLESNAAME